MAWVRVPLDPRSKRRDDEMDEMKAALMERDTTARLALFSRNAITEPSDVNVQRVGKLGERRAAFVELLADDAARSRCWRADYDEDFKELVEIPTYANTAWPGTTNFVVGPLPVPGMTTPGNLDIFTRPSVYDGHGSYSSVRTISFDVGGSEVLIPTVVGSAILSNADAIQHFYDTGEHLGIFDNVPDCNAYAAALHLQQEDWGRTQRHLALGPGELNVFEYAGLPLGTWSKLLRDRIHRLHVNEFRTVMDKLVRCISGESVSAVGTDYVSNVSSNAVWNTARAASLAGQNGGGGGNLWQPWFGRFGGDLAPPSGYAVDTITAKRTTLTFDTSSLAGRTVSKAWLFLQRYDLYTDTYIYNEHFDFAIRIGSTDLRVLNSADPADITDFQMLGMGFDVWVASVDPVSLVSLTGNTVVELDFRGDPLADVSGWAAGKFYSQAFAYSPTGMTSLATMIIELDDFLFCAPSA